MNAVLRNYRALMESLDELYDENGPPGAKADGLLDKMRTCEYFMGFAMCNEVFRITEQLATALQRKQMTLSGSRASAMTVVYCERNAKRRLLS